MSCPALAVLWPQPRQAEIVPDTHLSLPIEIVAPPELAAPAALLRRELTGLFGPAAVAKKGTTTIRLALEPEKLARLGGICRRAGGRRRAVAGPRHAGRVLGRAHAGGAAWGNRAALPMATR